MAGSAKSKGYRKYSKKKNAHQWTPKEKKVLLIGGIAVAVLLLVLAAWQPIYDSIGRLKVEKENLTVVGVDDNVVVFNLGTQHAPKVYGIARVDRAPAGFEPAKVERSLYYSQELDFYAGDEDTFPHACVFSGTKGDYLEAATKNHENIVSDASASGVGPSELVEETVDGKKLAYFTRTYSVPDQQDDGTVVTKYYQYLIGYVKARRSDCCLRVMVGGRVASEADFVDDSVLRSTFEEAVRGMTII